MNLKTSESEFQGFIEDNLSHAEFFSCVVLYENAENLAWFAALRVGEMIRNYFESKIDKHITIYLTLKLRNIISNLEKMEENDVFLLSTDNINIKSISSYLASETLNKKRCMVFISKEDNPWVRPFKDITNVVIHVKNISKKKLNCIIVISDKGERELEINYPEEELINKYLELRDTLLRETIRR